MIDPRLRGEKGRRGEEAAAAWLTGRAYTIIARNYRWRGGEIDIIALSGDYIAFVEVKTWDAFSVNDLEYAIGPVKRARIIETSKIFLDRHRQYKGLRPRFDVMFVQGGGTAIRQFESAFTE